MKHLASYTLFLERNDIPLAEHINKESEDFFARIVKRVVDIFYKYIDKCHEYSVETCSDYADAIWSQSLNRGRVGKPSCPITIQRKVGSANATYDATMKVIVVHDTLLLELLNSFEDAAGKALMEPNPDNRWEWRDDAAVYREQIEEYDYSKAIHNLSHELVHHYDNMTKPTSGWASMADIMNDKNDKLYRKVNKHVKKMQAGVHKYNIADYRKSKEYLNFTHSSYTNMNHEYNAFYTAYASAILKDVKAGKKIPDSFNEFVEMSEKDYPDIRLKTMYPKKRKAMLKRMYDLYIKLKQ